jgi:hypothetical protein
MEGKLLATICRRTLVLRVSDGLLRALGGPLPISVSLFAALAPTFIWRACHVACHPALIPQLAQEHFMDEHAAVSIPIP